MNYMKPYIEAFFKLPRLWFLFLAQIFLDAALGIMTFLPLFLAISLFLRAILLSPLATGDSVEDIIEPLRIMFGNTCVAFTLSGFMAFYLLTAFMMKVLIRSVVVAGISDIARGLPFAGPSRLISGAIRLWPRLILLYIFGFIGNILFIVTSGGILLFLLYIADPYFKSNWPAMRYLADIIYILAVIAPLALLYVLGLAIWYLAHLSIGVDDLCCFKALKASWQILWKHCSQLTIFLLALLYPVAMLGLVSMAGGSMLLNVRYQSGFAGVFFLASNAWSLTFVLAGYAVNLFVMLGMAVFYRTLSDNGTNNSSL